MANRCTRIPEIMMPREGTDLSKWAVIACDQYTSQPEYWAETDRIVGDAPSTLRLTLPEVYLEDADVASHIERIHKTMQQYVQDGTLRTLPAGAVLTERWSGGSAPRRGIVLAVDLEAYEYTPGSASLIRPTEKTVVERIPPRLKVREGACLELPHIMILIDDPDRRIIEPLFEKTGSFSKLYDTDLMQNGGHITGWLVEGKDVDEFNKALTEYTATVGEKYTGLKGTPMVFAVGDGNHSLATAKSCYEELKKNNPGVDLSNHPARYALVELENIHDPAQVFEPIHRVIFKTEPKKLLAALEAACAGAEGFPVKWYAGEESGIIVLDKNKGELAVGILQHLSGIALMPSVKVAIEGAVVQPCNALKRSGRHLRRSCSAGLLGSRASPLRRLLRPLGDLWAYKGVSLVLYDSKALLYKVVFGLLGLGRVEVPIG